MKTDLQKSMVSYTGTKTLLAVAMTLGEYNKLRGLNPPDNEDPEKEGYFVEYPIVGDDDKPNLKGHDGYVSWSPAKPFEKHYVRGNPQPIKENETE